MKKIIKIMIVLAMFCLPAVLLLASGSKGAFLDAVTDTEIATRRQGVLEYAVHIAVIPSDKKKLEIWLPIPRDNLHQHIGKLEFSGPLKFEIRREKEYGNRYAYAKLKNPKIKSADISVKIPFRRYAVNAQSRLDKQKVNFKRYLQPDRLIPLNGAILAEKKKIPASKAALPRRIYDYVVTTMSYDKTGKGWGRGDLNRACDLRRGNCTDFHSMFIGLARSSGVAARFVMGVPLPRGKNGPIQGYHCWAEFWNEAQGWRPVDASEASKNPAKREQLYGGLDADRLEFSRGRDVNLNPAPAQGPLNYFFYPVVEADRMTVSGVKLKLSVKKL